MDFALQPVSDAGRDVVSRCEGHEADFFARAARQDQEGRFPEENTADLIKSGIMAATVPAAFGGSGIVSLRDHAAGMNRLGRGDGSTAIATNMHLWAVWMTARAWRAAKITGDVRREQILAGALQEVAAGRRIVAVLATENGSFVLNPLTEATRGEDGWHLTGRKAFATGSPVATHFAVRLRYKNADGAWRIGSTTIARDSPGVTVLGNWDALGMRGSGSHDVVLERCFVPDDAIADGGAWGELTAQYMITSVSGVMGLVAAFLGIAEAARGLAVRQIMARGRGERASIQHAVAAMEIDLATARAALERSATIADALFEAHPLTIPDDALRRVTAEFQGTKHFVTRKAIAIVDQAMSLSGGAGFLSANPLSRLYRDVRAGPFMQPFSQFEAFELIGKVALGLPE